MKGYLLLTRYLSIQKQQSFGPDSCKLDENLKIYRFAQLMTIHHYQSHSYAFCSYLQMHL
jgi:hypothetical protein